MITPLDIPWFLAGLWQWCRYVLSSLLFLYICPLAVIADLVSTIFAGIGLARYEQHGALLMAFVVGFIQMVWIAYSFWCYAQLTYGDKILFTGCFHICLDGSLSSIIWATLQVAYASWLIIVSGVCWLSGFVAFMTASAPCTVALWVGIGINHLASADS